ncbi:PIG-L family deacetylase [Sphingomonas sp. BIUV-7]|uniref:PIG-L family deacetylase n=1 Tax=Sphingomonas natans TaxID=3063330 RepID=A0ABT8Y9U4_9SPHN|nr:PIG-L family deacetylase [Sphingomonas sp. BIUV-7]MDO6415100.1 PIG-L family deacetylase [Sphingomonas sp. BIUV-7]
MVAIPLNRSIFARARWLILAPHADDETLGAGALIAEAARAGRLGAVAFMTDGSGSHACDDAGARRRLITLREREAGLALRRLAKQGAVAPVFLGWRDADPHAADAGALRRTQDRLLALCRTRRIDAIAVTAGDEPHCDHAAAFQLARAVCRRTPGSLALFRYAVWSETAPSGRAFETKAMPVGVRRHALQAHRSQLTASFGPGFRLPRAKQRMPARDRLYLWESRHAA